MKLRSQNWSWELLPQLAGGLSPPARSGTQGEELGGLPDPIRAGWVEQGPPKCERKGQVQRRTEEGESQEGDRRTLWQGIWEDTRAS